jgi:hypothetical protein
LLALNLRPSTLSWHLAHPGRLSSMLLLWIPWIAPLRHHRHPRPTSTVRASGSPRLLPNGLCSRQPRNRTRPILLLLRILVTTPTLLTPKSPAINLSTSTATLFRSRSRTKARTSHINPMWPPISPHINRSASSVSPLCQTSTYDITESRKVFSTAHYECGLSYTRHILAKSVLHRVELSSKSILGVGF